MNISNIEINSTLSIEITSCDADEIKTTMWLLQRAVVQCANCAFDAQTAQRED